jgi:hypothetical protein
MQEMKKPHVSSEISFDVIISGCSQNQNIIDPFKQSKTRNGKRQFPRQTAAAGWHEVGAEGARAAPRAQPEPSCQPNPHPSWPPGGTGWQAGPSAAPGRCPPCPGSLACNPTTLTVRCLLADERTLKSDKAAWALAGAEGLSLCQVALNLTLLSRVAPAEDGVDALQVLQLFGISPQCSAIIESVPHGEIYHCVGVGSVSRLRKGTNPFHIVF